MDSLIENLQAIREYIEEIDPTISREDCIDCIRKQYFDCIVLQDSINDKEFGIIWTVAVRQSDIIAGNSFEEIISRMIVFARERSKGACFLVKCLFHNDLYDSLFKDYTGKVSYRGILIEKCDLLKQKEFLIGLCQSKFRACEIENLAVLGKIGE
jgi:hypothetical protein